MATPEAFSDHLCWLLGRASWALTGELASALAEIGLSPRMHEVLLGAASGEHTQIELARMIGLDKTTMVVTVDELEAAGLAERRPSRTDRRARVIAVTAAGTRRLRRADEILHRVHERVLDELPARERAAFLEGLTRLVRGPLADPPPSAPPARRRAPSAIPPAASTASAAARPAKSRRR